MRVIMMQTCSALRACLMTVVWAIVGALLGLAVAGLGGLVLGAPALIRGDADGFFSSLERSLTSGLFAGAMIALFIRITDGINPFGEHECSTRTNGVDGHSLRRPADVPAALAARSNALPPSTTVAQPKTHLHEMN